MRIGILTFHRAHNYGAVLQCYALQRFLISLGHDAKVIDYNKKELWAFYNWYRKSEFDMAYRFSWKMPVRVYRLHKRIKPRKDRYNKFVDFQENILKLDSVSSINDAPYDLILIGSDQVWNTTITHGFDPFYWGTFDKPAKTKVATYAASMKKYWTKEEEPIAIENLLRLNAISVREESVGEHVKSIAPQLKVTAVPDPVLLLSEKDWSDIAAEPKIKEKYAFFYQAWNSNDVLNTAKNIAKERGLKLVVLSADVNGPNSDICRSASPQEFIGWIKNADLVLTSSFHALAFSILLNKDFYAINLNVGKDDRLRNLVSLFHLEGRLINDETEASALSPFDGKEVLTDLRNTAINYLDSI